MSCRLIGKLAIMGAVAAIVVTVGMPGAAADPSTPPTSGVGLSSTALPRGFPAGLQKYVGGTKEFKAASWNTGACRDQGGDVGAYVNAIEPVEGRLMYWAEPASQRAALWKFLIKFNLVNDPGGDLSAKEPPHVLWSWPGTSTNPAYQFPSTCAYQLRHWTPAAGTTFGFVWAPKVDAITVAHINDPGFAKSVDVANRACWDRGSIFCAKAYFVDCSTATGNDLVQCAAWNKVAVNLQVGLHRWADAHTSYETRLKQVLGGAGAALTASGKFVASAFSAIAQFFGAVVDFVLHPGAEIDRLANRAKSGAIGLMQTVFTSYNEVSTWDLSRGEFLHRYAMVAALGWTLLAVMFFGAVKRAHESGDREALVGILHRLVGAGALMAFAPMFASLLVTTSSKLTDSIIDKITSVSAGELTAKLVGLNAITSAIPGGVLVGVLLFGLMFLGAIGLFIGLMIERFGMELGTIFFALVAGLYVHPRWKARVNKLGYMVTGVIFAKPVVILAVGLALGIANDNLSPAAWSGGGFGVLAALTLTAVAVLFCGLAPFALLKWAPVLPTDGGSHDRSSAGLMTGAVIGGAGSMLAQAAANGRGRPAASASPGANADASSTAGDGARPGGGAGRPGPLRAAAAAGQLAGAASTAGRSGAAGTSSTGTTAKPIGTSAASTAGGSGAVAASAASRSPETKTDGSGAGAGSSRGGGAGAGVWATSAVAQAAITKARHSVQHQAPQVDEPDERS